MTLSSSAASSSGVAPARESVRSPWLGVSSLGIGVFALVTSEFLPASLLSPISADLQVSAGLAGQAVSATAVTGAISALTIAALLPRLDRRTIMIGLTALAILSNLAVAVATTFPLLVAGRLILGVAIGGFWALAIPIAVRLVSADRLGRALTVVNTGVSLATVAAIPLGTWLGEVWGWRPVFVLAAALGGVALVLQLLWLGPVPPTGAPGLRTLLATARTPVIILGLAAIALIAGGHFAAFTYIRPAVDAIAGLDAGALAGLFVVYGLTGFLGNLLSGPLADRSLRAAVLLFPALIGVSLLVFVGTGGFPVATIAAVALWGFAFGGVPTAVSTWIARAQPDRVESAGGLSIATFQVAIAVGAVVGGILVDVIDVRASVIAGAVAALLGGLVLSAVRVGARP